jgi:hypothetical protein
MKRNLLLLAVMAIAVVGLYNLGAAQCNPNDAGVCDTLYMECWPGDEVLTGVAPWDVTYPIYVTHDVDDPTMDSIAGIVIPLHYTYTNAAANVTIDPLKNHCGDGEDVNRALHNLLYNLNNSVFRDLPTMEVPTELNWMMDISSLGGGKDWDTRILDLGVPGDIRISLVASGSSDFRMGPVTHRLLMSIRFTLQDSTNICIDTTFWPPSGRVTFALGGVGSPTLIPQIWDDYNGPEVCVEHYIPPNYPPYFDRWHG